MGSHRSYLAGAFGCTHVVTANPSVKTRALVQVGLDNILITPQLALRTPHASNHKAENEALNALARELANRPQRLPQKLTALALGLTNAGSAGISVLKEEAGKKYFEWEALSGAFAAHAGGRTGVEFSPCGVTLLRGAPQLFSRPARHFAYLQRIKPVIAEALVGSGSCQG